MNNSSTKSGEKRKKAILSSYELLKKSLTNYGSTNSSLKRYPLNNS